MQKRPLVSVVMSVYDRTDYLGEAVESILSQTYQTFNLIIVVEYSKRQTEICETLRSYQDSRIQIICGSVTNSMG